MFVPCTYISSGTHCFVFFKNVFFIFPIFQLVQFLQWAIYQTTSMLWPNTTSSTATMDIKPSKSWEHITHFYDLFHYLVNLFFVSYLLHWYFWTCQHKLAGQGTIISCMILILILFTIVILQEPLTLSSHSHLGQLWSIGGKEAGIVNEGLPLQIPDLASLAEVLLGKALTQACPRTHLTHAHYSCSRC